MKKKLLFLFLFVCFNISAQTLPYISAPLKPRINGAKAFGVKPGAVFLFTIAVTGERPVEFQAKGLPAGLKINPASGTITGKITKKGEYTAEITVKNKHGKAEGLLKIIVGDHIALTPPMGWDGGNTFKVQDQHTLKLVEDFFVKYDLANHGYTYVVINDSWQGKRGGKHGAIQPDTALFPDFKKTIDQLHKAGLKVGIYSSPWVVTPANHIGSSADSIDGFIARHTKDFKKDFRVGKYPLHKQDIKQWTDWGIDLLKYEWNPTDVRHARQISEALKKNSRDIIFSIAGNASYEHAAEWERIANVWSTREYPVLVWDSLRAVSPSQEPWSPYSGPGHWAYPGSLAVGSFKQDSTVTPTRLSHEEQMTQFSLWSLLSSPLFLSCDLSRPDAFMLSLISNDEVIDVDQDAQGTQARKVFSRESEEVLAKSLQDGSLAVGLFNKSDAKAKITISWKDLGILGAREVRDLWQQKDLGKFKENFEAEVPAHGVVLVKIVKP